MADHPDNENQYGNIKTLLITAGLALYRFCTCELASMQELSAEVRMQDSSGYQDAARYEIHLLSRIIIYYRKLSQFFKGHVCNMAFKNLLALKGIKNNLKNIYCMFVDKVTKIQQWLFID